MSRIQLAVNVSDLEEAIDFYSRFFNAASAKVRPGYANFAIDDPPLKLVLIESEASPGSLNHLGVEVFSSDEVVRATKYLSDVGFETRVEENSACCFAVQDKVWVDGVDGSPWEVYTVLEDSAIANATNGDDTCCTTERTENASDHQATACC
jgi:catechol 2,3-dioxygenase-like lactoylglutathione lyase family enzyme